MEQTVFWEIEPEDLFAHEYQRLAEATRTGDTSLLLSLLQGGASITPSRPLPTASLTPLAIEACIAGENDALEILLEHDPAQSLNAVDPVRRASALHWAANRGDSGAARLLLKHGARPDIVDIEGLTPLHYAAEAGRRALLDLFISSGGATVDSRAAGSQVTPLILAAGHGHLRCVEYLIIHNADISAADSLGRTPLIMAAMSGRAAVAKALLAAGADPAAIDAVQRRTALHWASNYGWAPLVEILLEANASMINAADLEEETALLLASRRGYDPIVVLLLHHGAAVDAANRSGVTSLAAAALFSHDPVVAHLLGAGAGIEVVDLHMRRTPLHHAALGGSAAVVSRLLQHGARGDVVDVAGQTPRELALDAGDEALIELLSQL